MGPSPPPRHPSPPLPACHPEFTSWRLLCGSLGEHLNFQTSGAFQSWRLWTPRSWGCGGRGRDRWIQDADPVVSNQGASPFFCSWKPRLPLPRPGRTEGNMKAKPTSKLLTRGGSFRTEILVRLPREQNANRFAEQSGQEVAVRRRGNTSALKEGIAVRSPVIWLVLCN